MAAASYESKTDAYARIKAQRAKSKRQRERGEFLENVGLGGLSGIIGALDFQEDIAEDRDLLASIKRLGKGEKMDRAQYGALRRKVGGTKAGFFGETVEAKGRYLESGRLSSYDEDDVDGKKKFGGVVLGATAGMFGLVAFVLSSLP